MLPFLSHTHLVDICVSKPKLTLRTTGTERYSHAYRSILRMKFRSFHLHLTSRSEDEDFIEPFNSSLCDIRSLMLVKLLERHSSSRTA